jgi:hypothetical protein
VGDSVTGDDDGFVVVGFKLGVIVDGFDEGWKVGCDEEGTTEG